MDNVVVLGNFDGIHLAHKKLLKEAIKYARINNMKCIAYTFKTIENHNRYILTDIEKQNEMLKLGIDEVYLEDFYSVKNYTTSEFIENKLKKVLNAKVVFCGYNYTFGKDKSGNIDTLRNSIKTFVIDEYKYRNNKVSSTIIRELIEKGKMKSVNKLLGKNLYISGTVIHGKELGRKIGFPTANIKPNKIKVMPPLGVYGVEVEISNYKKKFLGIMNIGKNPTVKDNEEIIIETHILNFNDDIYGEKIICHLFEIIRLEKKFDSLDMLKEQIKKDINIWVKKYDKY